jgi:hypothetical protein
MVFELIEEDTDSIVLLLVAKFKFLAFSCHFGISHHVPERHDVSEVVGADRSLLRDSFEIHSSLKLPVRGFDRLKQKMLEAGSCDSKRV